MSASVAFCSLVPVLSDSYGRMATSPVWQVATPIWMYSACGICNIAAVAEVWDILRDHMYSDTDKQAIGYGSGHVLERQHAARCIECEANGYLSLHSILLSPPLSPYSPLFGSCFAVQPCPLPGGLRYHFLHGCFIDRD